jgi:hypothetical protein
MACRSGSSDLCITDRTCCNLNQSDINKKGFDLEALFLCFKVFEAVS